MNRADSERLAVSLEERGFRPAATWKEADLLVINSCSVRQASEDKVYGLAPKALKLKTENCKLKIILTGCMVGSAVGERKRTHFGELKAKMPWVDEFLTPTERHLKFPAGGWSASGQKTQNEKTALVPIMEGCNHFCSYCVVPYARGVERSKPFEEIVCEVRKMVRNGIREVVLLGQNVNSYGKDLGELKVPRSKSGAGASQKFKTPFAKLLVALNKIEGLKKIKFLTSNPWDLTDDIIEAMCLPKVEKYLHLPVQSGDDRVLRRMNRPYTVRQYKKLVGKIKKRLPEIRIGTDIIVGFPGETKGQFENTVKLLGELSFDTIYVAKYSPRPGTAAARLSDDVPMTEKKRRHKVVLSLARKTGVGGKDGSL